MYLDTATDMNETLNPVPGDNSDADFDLGYEKNFQNGISDYDNESPYIPIVPTLSEESAIPIIVYEDAVDHIPKEPHRVVKVMFVLSVLLLILIVVQSGVHHTCGEDHGRKKSNVDKDNLDGPDDGLQINQNWIWKKIDEVEEDNDETIAILAEDKRLKIS